MWSFGSCLKMIDSRRMKCDGTMHEQNVHDAHDLSLFT
jgi:hypothetical protein